MHKFIYTPDPNNQFDHVSVEITTESLNLAQVLKAIEAYLYASGFVLNGELEVVPKE